MGRPEKETGRQEDDYHQDEKLSGVDLTRGGHLHDWRRPDSRPGGGCDDDGDDDGDSTTTATT